MSKNPINRALQIKQFYGYKSFKLEKMQGFEADANIVELIEAHLRGDILTNFKGLKLKGRDFIVTPNKDTRHIIVDCFELFINDLLSQYSKAGLIKYIIA